MSAYIKLSTLEYPRHEGDIRIEHPEILADQTGDSFPCPSTYELVSWVNPPAITDMQICYEGAPILIDGAWQITWIVRDATPEELTLPVDPLDVQGTVPDVIG